MSKIIVHDEVASALGEGQPIVALETAVVTHGLPREPLQAPAAGEAIASMTEDWSMTRPTNLEAALAMRRRVLEQGAVPASIAVIDGMLRIGLDDDDLHRLAMDEAVEKIADADLAAAMARGVTGGTTVSATLLACTLAEPAPIRVFATGGIGGVHRGWTTVPDISADLRALARHPVCVCCAGAKSVLDIRATVEALQTLGVPILGWRTDWFPRFYATGSPDLPVPHRAEEAEAVGAICQRHWQDLHQESSVLVTIDPPGDFALDPDWINQLLLSGEARASEKAVAGPARTPHLLAELARETEGRSLVANIALLVNNAAVAGLIAAHVRVSG